MAKNAEVLKKIGELVDSLAFKLAILRTGINNIDDIDDVLDEIDLLFEEVDIIDVPNINKQ